MYLFLYSFIRCIHFEKFIILKIQKNIKTLNTADLMIANFINCFYYSFASNDNLKIFKIDESCIGFLILIFVFGLNALA